MVKAWFISDVHVTTESDIRGQKLIKFLQGLNRQNATHLFLVGDIFDLWIAHHLYFQKKYSQIIDELQRLRSDGVEIHYFEGNHDLYLEHYFQNELGFKVHAGPETFEIANMKIRVEHGDQTDPDDHGYRFLRWLLRTPVLKWLAPRLPGQWIVALGEWLSRRSRTYTSAVKTISNERAIEKLREHAARMIQIEGFDLLVAGHVHVQDDHRFQIGYHAARAVNLGSWFHQPKAFLVTSERQDFVEI